MALGSSSDQLKDPASFAESLRGKLKPVMVCISHSWGGLEQVAANDAAELGALGLPIRVIVLEGTPIHERLAHRKELEILPLSFRPRDYFDLKMRRELLRLLKEGVNLFHLHQTSLLGSFSPWLWGSPEVALMASRHIMNSHDKRNFFHSLIYGRVDALLVMSETLRRNVLDTHPLKERQVKIVNLGLDFTKFDPDRVNASEQRARWGAGPDTVVIGLVGRIDPAKGQDTFIKAAAGLMKGARSGEKFKFVIVGEETLGRASGHLQALKALVRSFHLENDVVFTGYQENIAQAMRSFDIFVMPSRQEAFGLVAIEAMAMECPIIISRGGSAEEIVGDQEYGLLIRAQDAFDLQSQIRFMIDHPKERQEMGRRARAHVRANYDRKMRLQRTLEIYDRSLRLRSRRF